MNTNRHLLVLCFVILSLCVSSCGAAPALSPTATLPPTSTPLPTLTDTPVPTSTATPIPTPADTATPEPTATATPTPICKTGNTIQGTTDSNLPGYLDLTKVSTSLVGTKLTVVFNLKELPDKITINQKDLKQGQSEIAWGVAIDVDHNPETGGKVFMTGAGYGYDAFLQTFHFKQAGGERTGPINLIFQGETLVWKILSNGGISSGAAGSMKVDTQAKTLTLTGTIPNITPDSTLYFYSFYADAKNPGSPMMDELCQR